MDTRDKPSLFGLKNSNRDFTLKSAWGKNQFNSSFPASLCCYLHKQGKNANYLSVGDKGFGCSEINIEDVFGISPSDNEIFFAFEAAHSPFQQYVVGPLPRTDLVIQNKNGTCLSGLEIKLTALPDNTTCNLKDSQYGCEIVVRPDTIAYLACSIAKNLGEKLKLLINPVPHIDDWSDAKEVIRNIDTILNTLKKIGNRSSPPLAL